MFDLFESQNRTSETVWAVTTIGYTCVKMGSYYDGLHNENAKNNERI